MRHALARSVWTGRVEPVRSSTRLALAERDLCDCDGTVTPLGRVAAISLLRLHEQCEVLGLPLDTHVVPWDGRPEHTAVGLLGPTQFAFADEGQMLHALIHALVLPRLNQVAVDAWRDADRARSYLYGSYAAYTFLLDFEPTLPRGMLADVERWDLDSFARSWALLHQWNRWGSHPARTVSIEDALSVLNGVGLSRLLKVTQTVLGEPFAYFRGWPDLMAISTDERLRFVEVKTTDTLHFGQIVTISDMRAAAGLDISVIRLCRPPHDRVVRITSQ